MSYTREQLRATVVSQADRVQNNWFIWNRMTPADRNICLAGRQCISRDVPVTNSYLDDFNGILNTMQDHPYARVNIAGPSSSDVAQALAAFVTTLFQWISSFFGRSGY